MKRRRCFDGARQRRDRADRREVPGAIAEGEEAGCPFGRLTSNGDPGVWRLIGSGDRGGQLPGCGVDGEERLRIYVFTT